jgi:heparan-alpha-glucosaminide N-acetyltransferase
LGFLLQGEYYHGINNLNYGVDLNHICWFGISQRIAFAYIIITLFEI